MIYAILTKFRGCRTGGAVTALINVLQDPWCGLHGGGNCNLGRTIGRLRNDGADDIDVSDVDAIILALVSMGCVAGVPGRVTATHEIRKGELAIGANEPVYLELDGDLDSWNTLDFMTSRDNGNSYFLLHLHAVTKVANMDVTCTRHWAGVWRTHLPEVGQGWLISTGANHSCVLFIKHENLQRALFVRQEQRVLEEYLSRGFGWHTVVTLFDPDILEDPASLVGHTGNDLIPEGIVPRNIILVPRIQLKPSREYNDLLPTELPYPVIRCRDDDITHVHAHQLIQTIDDFCDAITDVNYLFPLQVGSLPKQGEDANDNPVVTTGKKEEPFQQGDAPSRANPEGHAGETDRPPQRGDGLKANQLPEPASAEPNSQARAKGRLRQSLNLSVNYIGDTNDVRLGGVIFPRRPIVLQVNRHTDTISSVVARYFETVGAVRVEELLDHVAVSASGVAIVELDSTPNELHLDSGELIELFLGN